MSKNRDKVDSAITDALSSVTLFSGLPKKTLQQIASMCHEHRFAPGDEMVTQGDLSGRFYMILEGGAEVRANGHVVNTLGPGQHFGEYAVIDSQPRSATVVAATPVRAYSLASITLRPLLKEQPELTYRLLLNVCERVRALERSMT